MKIHLATGNAHKVREFQDQADGSGLAIEIVPGKMPAVVEDAGTFLGNARKKAQALHALLPAGSWVLADDSGVCVEALGGGPGVESAYFAGPQHDSAANLQKLIEVMRGVPAGRRGAHFICVLVLFAPDGQEWNCEGRCDGVLAMEPAGGAGFGYDPIFVPAGFDRTYAQLTDGEKNRLSHRARAWAAMAVEIRRVSD